MSAPLVFVDTETTGLDPTRRRPWEIALIRRDDEDGQRELRIVIGDIDLTDAEPMGLKVGGFYDRHPRYGGFGHTPESDVCSERDAAVAVERWTRAAHLVGANPSFDETTLAAMLRRHKLVPAWHHRLRCVETLAAGYLRREVGGLKGAAEALGLPVEETELHTAMGDARLARDIWDFVMMGGAA